MTLAEQAQAVQTREELVAFILALAANLRDNPDGWENVKLASYLGAMAAWIQDMEGYYKNNGMDISKQSIWKVTADMLMAARIYE